MSAVPRSDLSPFSEGLKSLCARAARSASAKSLASAGGGPGLVRHDGYKVVPQFGIAKCSNFTMVFMVFVGDISN